MGSGRVKGYTHGWIAFFVRMSKPSNSKFFEIAHEVESGNIEPDFIFFRKEQNFTVTKIIIIIICGT